MEQDSTYRCPFDNTPTVSTSQLYKLTLNGETFMIPDMLVDSCPSCHEVFASGSMIQPILRMIFAIQYPSHYQFQNFIVPDES